MVSKAWINVHNNIIIVHVGYLVFVFDQFLIYYTDANASLLLTMDDHSKKLEQLERIVARLEASGMLSHR